MGRYPTLIASNAGVAVKEITVTADRIACNKGDDTYEDVDGWGHLHN